MLHFMYTDSLPDMSHEDIQLVMLVQYLLEAADIYALDGLKMICEERLIRDLSLDTVTSSLALAEEHNCSELKDACLAFAYKPEILVQLALKAEYVQLMQ
ncbi:BTB/POZ and MATH domain-containing protein 1 [Rhynchospora pubera]|uniref:BTB/POZ and MATH domain-containing protein 1 n=1 Tax=Rhynchospora pubera TaxID=906938 RepID=A0AAV8HEB0_9POAL|nr:BTB/POZ and MATH domain-containing protein 1 [Rhynchospora pubera]